MAKWCAATAMRAMQANRGGDRNTKLRQVRLDRVQFLAEMRTSQLPAIPGFRVERDCFVRRRISISTYRRVRTCKNHRTGTKLFIQYRPACPWLCAVKITAIGDDRQGLRRPELRTLFNCFVGARLLLIEVAVDFLQVSGVDCRFVSRHAVFGKSRPRASSYPDSLRLGSRKSDTLIRCYPKSSVSAYRVEMELHSSWLRRKNVQNLEDLRRLPDLLHPSHVKFVRIDWQHLRHYLRRRGLPARIILQQARARSKSIYAVIDYLRRQVGLVNTDRFLRLIPQDREIYSALMRWALQWE